MHDIDPDTDTNLEQDNSYGNYGIHYRRHTRNFNTLPAIYQDVDMNVDMDMDTYIVYCRHGIPIGSPCQECTAADQQKRLDQTINNLEYNCDSEPEFEEPEELKMEPFDDYTRELVVRLLFVSGARF